MKVNGRLVMLDLHDDSEVRPEQYQRADIYFKRMCRKADLAALSKLQPLGLIFPCYHRPLRQLGYFLRTRPAVVHLKQVLRYLPIPFLMGGGATASNMLLKKMECNDLTREFAIGFQTQVWDPARATGEKAQGERLRINEERILLVRELRSKFGSRFVGGLSMSNQLAETYGDLLLPKNLTQKAAYLKLLKRLTVGVASTGLKGSVGFKFAEYMAAGMAILSVPNIREVALPAPLTEGEHYLVFDNAQQCARHAQMLLENPTVMRDMMRNNHAYYSQFLRPDVLMKRVVELAAG
jgi:glycosyltransferase involved in cell wall biosynthesis